jgi:hypothetical protein
MQVAKPGRFVGDGVTIDLSFHGKRSDFRGCCRNDLESRHDTGEHLGSLHRGRSRPVAFAGSSF